MLKLRAIACSGVFLAMLLTGCDFGTYSERVQSNGGSLPMTAVSQDSGSAAKDSGSDSKDSGSAAKTEGSESKDSGSAAKGSDSEAESRARSAGSGGK